MARVNLNAGQDTRLEDGTVVRFDGADTAMLLALAAELPGSPGLGELQSHHIRRFVGLLHGRGRTRAELASIAHSHDAHSPSAQTR